MQTPNVTEPLADAMGGLGGLARGTGNTHVIAHGGKLLALEEAHWPWALDRELNTIGYENFGGALTCSMTAHPKVCPITGELLAFSYFSFEPRYLHDVRISPDGQVRQVEGSTSVRAISAASTTAGSDFSAAPVATIHLPQRVPYGAHGSWVPTGAVA